MVEVADGRPNGVPPDAPVVVAGVGRAAFPIAVAALEAGHTVVRLVTGPHQLPGDADDRLARFAAAAPPERLTITADAATGAGFAVAVLTEAPEHDPDVDGVSPVEHYTAALASYLRAGCLVAVSSAMAQRAGEIVDATVELLTGLCAGRDYALGHLFPPTAEGRLVVSGIDAASAERARTWLQGLGLTATPVLPVTAATAVATLLAATEHAPARSEPEHGDHSA